MKKNGFTLIELMVAGAILGIVGFIAYQSLNNVTRAHDSQYIEQQLTLNTTKCLDIIKRVIRRANIDTAGSGITISGFATTQESISINIIPNDSDPSTRVAFNYSTSYGGIIYVGGDIGTGNDWDTIAENVSAIDYTYDLATGILVMDLTVTMRGRSKRVRDIAITRIVRN